MKCLQSKQIKLNTNTAKRHNLNIYNTHNNHVKPHTLTQTKTFNNGMCQNSDIPSPVSFFLDDNENISIPHLPPLILPGIGTSYNTSSMQNQQIHLNHNSYQQQFHQLPYSLLFPSQTKSQPYQMAKERFICTYGKM